jgi:hypothetical protein
LVRPATCFANVVLAHAGLLAEEPAGVQVNKHFLAAVQARYRVDRLGERFLCRHCAMRLRLVLVAQG